VQRLLRRGVRYLSGVTVRTDPTGTIRLQRYVNQRAKPFTFFECQGTLLIEANTLPIYL
jgi:hypothetical protein